MASSARKRGYGQAAGTWSAGSAGGTPTATPKPLPGHRQIVARNRMNGVLVSWQGTFGWIKPFYPLTHPAAAKNGGKLYLAQEDVQEDLGPPGSIASFTVYADGNGLGAMEVRTGVQTGNVHAGRPTRAVGNPYLKQPAAEPEPAPAYGQAAYGQTAYGQPTRRVQATPKSRARLEQGAARTPMNHEQLSNAVHSTLTETLWPSIEAIAHLEETWSPQETSKRVVRYLYKSAMAEDLTKLDWQEAVRQFVDKATASYISACAEKPWFEELDVTPAVAAASWAIAQACGGWPRPKMAQVAQLAMDLFHLCAHKGKFEKVLWEAIESYFALEDKVKSKFYHAFAKTYGIAFENARSKPGQTNFAQAEAFMKEWITEGLGRAWHGVQNSPDVLTLESLVEFFKGLITNFESEDLVSCLPPTLVEEGMERTAEDWEEFLLPLVQDIFNEWENPEPASSSKKRKKKKKANADEEDEGYEE
eukprot:TRINITY_DN56415_c0_g1_i1.p1 TRINITY_DN56415_c0_g1~~TRINITY_DN56415_c0_g1_i1.p1  ORF type:complete len:475 (+),score=99.92 TRINITY_DN56415_c0_g1_i1:80-1504(+)